MTQGNAGHNLSVKLQYAVQNHSATLPSVCLAITAGSTAAGRPRPESSQRAACLHSAAEHRALPYHICPVHVKKKYTGLHFYLIYGVLSNKMQVHVFIADSIR